MHTSPQTDRQNSGFTYDTTRLLRNAAMLGPSDTANITQNTNARRVYGDDETPL